jgi:hypothetical protein
VNGGMTPHETIIMDVHNVPDETPVLQLTQEQLLELQQLQQQMMQDLNGEDGEMM